MLRQRTTPILVIAILHLVGGGTDLLFSICGVGSLFMVDSLGSYRPPTVPARPGQPAQPMPPTGNDLMKQLNDQVPGYRAFTIGSLAMNFLLDIMLLSAGIGLLNMQPWARWVSLAYAPISILNRIGTSIYQLERFRLWSSAIQGEWVDFAGITQGRCHACLLTRPPPAHPRRLWSRTQHSGRRHQVQRQRVLGPTT